MAPPAWRAPVYARYRLLSIGAVIMSIAWLVGAGVFLIEGLKLSDLMALLPHELGGMAAGVITPLALLWIVVAYFERSKIYEKERISRNEIECNKTHEGERKDRGVMYSSSTCYFYIVFILLASASVIILHKHKSLSRINHLGY